jgi:SEC-C motif-containing protein
MLCPCHSGKQYAECCQPYHQKKALPKPVALMRSRYSAYAMGNIDYIIGTTHPDNPSAHLPLNEWKKQIALLCSHTRFTGLDILNAEETSPDAYVTFHAHLLQGEKDVSFTEKSRFAMKEGQWMYLSGELS